MSHLTEKTRELLAGLDLHVILDNSSTHKTAAIKQWLEKHPPFKLHFTPISASWLNAVEGWFAQLERRALYWGTFTSVADLKAAIRQFIEAHNEHHGLAAVDILDQIEVVKLSANRRWKVGDIPRPNLICRGRGISGWRLIAVRPLCSGAVMLLTRRMTFERGRYAGEFCSDHPGALASCRIFSVKQLCARTVCYCSDPGSVSTFLNVSTSGRKLIRYHAAHIGVVKEIHGTSRSTTPGGALRLRPFWIMAMPSPDVTSPRAVKGSVANYDVRDENERRRAIDRYDL